MLSFGQHSFTYCSPKIWNKIPATVKASTTWYWQQLPFHHQVDEERMRPSHWLGFVLFVPFSALTLIIGWQEGRLAA